MSRMTVRLWSYLLMPLPVVGVCFTCYTWKLGLNADVLAPVSLGAVCVVAFVVAAWSRGQLR